MPELQSQVNFLKNSVTTPALYAEATNCEIIICYMGTQFL